MKRGLLSAREEEIATLIADDLTDKEIALILRIDVRTVHKHLERIATRLALGQSPLTRRRALRAWVEER